MTNRGVELAGMLALAAMAVGPTRAESTDGSEPDSSSAPAPVVVVYERPQEEDRGVPDDIKDKIIPDADMHLVYRIEDQEGKTLKFDFQPRYDRVNELSLTFTQSLERADGLYPRLALRETFATGPEKAQYRLDFEQPILRGPRVSVGVAVFDETTVYADLIDRVGDGENTLAALLFREDFRHYHTHEGFLGTIRGRIPGGVVAAIVYRDARHKALGNATNGSLFRPRGSFRDNPQADEGKLRSWSVRFDFDSAGDSRRPGFTHRHRLEFETSGPRTRSNFDFERWSAESRFGLRVGPDQDLALRVRGGSVMSGRLPTQRGFYLGGIGTLRARDFGEFSGERALLINVEYAFTIFGAIQAVLFQDTGAAWMRPTDLGEVRPELDAGFALRNRTGRFRINFARDLRGAQEPIVVTVRLTQPF